MFVRHGVVCCVLVGRSRCYTPYCRSFTCDKDNFLQGLSGLAIFSWLGAQAGYSTVVGELEDGFGHLVPPTVGIPGIPAPVNPASLHVCVTPRGPGPQKIDRGASTSSTDYLL